MSTGRALALVQSTAVAFLESVRAGAIVQLQRDDLYLKLTEVVFAYWAARLNHPHAILDPKREKRIMARLRETRGEWGLLCYAVDGASRDGYLMGRDDRAPRKYDGISTIFRDLEQVERLAELCPKYRAGQPHPLVTKYEYCPNVYGEA